MNSGYTIIKGRAIDMFQVLVYKINFIALKKKKKKEKEKRTDIYITESIIKSHKLEISRIDIIHR
jgi:hypothetical protein